MELLVVESKELSAPYLKQITIAWCSMAFLIITMDVLSFLGLLPFPGGYTFPVVAFVYYSLGPWVCSIFSALTSCFTPAVLFVLLNVMIIAILMSSGCLASLTKEDHTSTLLPVATTTTAVSQARPEEDKGVSAVKAPRSLSRSPSGKSKGSRKPKRQLSAPAKLQQQTPKEFQELFVPEVASDTSSEQEEDCSSQSLLNHWHHSSSLIIMELPSDGVAASTEHPKASAAQGMGLYNNHLMTCDQDVFNKIIGNYIEKFKQDMRKQEVRGHELHLSSYSAKW